MGLRSVGRACLATLAFLGGPRLLAQEVGVAGEKGLPEEPKVVGPRVPLDADGEVFEGWFPKGEGEWRFLDTGELPGEGWRTLGFDDSAWKKGPGLLGYGDSDVVTEVSFGNDASNKHITAFFRRQLLIDDLDKVQAVAGRLICDDGAIVSVNGEVVHRENMSENHEGGWNHSLKETYNERQRWTFLIDKEHFVVGKNIIAASVHQWNGPTSDMAFELWLEPIVDEEALFDVEDAVAAEAIIHAEERWGGELPSAFHDGDLVRTDAAGKKSRQTWDATEEVARVYPGTRFARVYAGDTIERVAQRENVDIERLLILNRVEPGHVFRRTTLAAVEWKQAIVEGDTYEKIAAAADLSVAQLARLNAWELEKLPRLRVGRRLRVPPRFSYIAPDGRGQLGRLVLNGGELPNERFGGIVVEVPDAQQQGGLNLQEFRILRDDFEQLEIDVAEIFVDGVQIDAPDLPEAVPFGEVQDLGQVGGIVVIGGEEAEPAEIVAGRPPRPGVPQLDARARAQLEEALRKAVAQGEVDIAGLPDGVQLPEELLRAARASERREITHDVSTFPEGTLRIEVPGSRPIVERFVATREAEAAIEGARFLRASAGETLAAIAEARQLDVRRLVDLNRLPPEHRFERATILLADWSREVKKGETLHELAELHGCDLDTLLRLNDFKDAAQALKVGSSIRVPVGIEFRPPSAEEVGELRILVPRWKRPLRVEAPVEKPTRPVRLQRPAKVRRLRREMIVR